MHSVVSKEAHGVEMAGFGIHSVAVIVELVARTVIEDPAVCWIEPPGHKRLPVSHDVDHVRAVPLQVLEKIAKLEDGAHRSA
jgi:hypothetical protein